MTPDRRRELADMAASALLTLAQDKLPTGPEREALDAVVLHWATDRTDRIGKLEKALELALAYLGRQEPGDSRAVSDEYAAMLAVLCDVRPNSPGGEMAIIQAALDRPDVQGPA